VTATKGAPAAGRAHGVPSSDPFSANRPTGSVVAPSGAAVTRSPATLTFAAGGRRLRSGRTAGPSGTPEEDGGAGGIVR
jgi:hypothetical protein